MGIGNMTWIYGHTLWISTLHFLAPMVHRTLEVPLSGSDLLDDVALRFLDTWFLDIRLQDTEEYFSLLPLIIYTSVVSTPSLRYRSFS